MKLAQILAQSPLPSGSPARLASPTASPIAIGLQGLAEASQSIGRTAERVGALQARADTPAKRAEDAMQKHQDALDALSAVNTAGDALDQTETTLQMGRRDDTTGEVLEPPATHDLYLPRWEQQWEQIQGRALESARTPEAKMVIQKNMARLYGTRLAQARKYSNTLFVDQFGAGFEQNVEDLERKIGRATDPAEVQELEGLLGRAFDMATGVIPLKTLQARARQAEERIDTVRAQRLGATDPTGAQQALRAGGYRLPQERAEHLAEAIGKDYDRRVQQQEAAQTRAQTILDKEQTEAYHAETSDLYAAVKSKLGTTEQVEEWRRKYRGRAGLDEDYLRLTRILEEPKKPVKEWKSDPKVAGRVAVDVLSVNPTYTPADLQRLNESELLDENDLKYALNALKQNADHKRSLGETAEGRQRAQMATYHAQAEQELRLAIMGPESFFKQYDEKKERLYEQAITQLRTRSLLYGGKENPLDAKDQMIPAFRKAAGSQTLMTANEARAGLTYPSLTALEAARKARKITDPYYREQHARFMVIEQAEKALRDNAAGGDPDSAKALEKLRGGKAAPAPTAPAGSSVPYMPTLTPRRVD